MKLKSTLAAALLASVAFSSAAHAAFVVTYEPETPGMQTSNTTATFQVSGTENFETYSSFNGTTDVSTALPASSNVSGSQTYQTFSTDFGTKGQITGVYSGVQIIAADQYGGAGGSGQYAVSFGGSRGQPYSLTLTSVPGVSVNYFGYWLSALDAGNTLTFYEGNTQVYQFNAADVKAALVATGNYGAYAGNPNANYAGNDYGEPFAYFNFYDTTGSFDKIVFSEVNNGSAGYESDNQTVGYKVITYGNGGSKTDVPNAAPDATPNAVPEPATWTMMILGVGAIGAVLRSRRRPARAAQAA
jgi:cyclic lactone autoinducer peptide